MVQERKVYLDRHIPRDNMLYKKSSDRSVHESPEGMPPKLLLTQLFGGGEDAKDDLLRKPDFQRATSAWTPKECVSLLVSVLREQVIPSIIMWRSPENFWYVLDGGHRLSVVLAWLRDDWGDKLTADEYMDRELEANYKKAAQEVRRLLAEAKIKRFEEYRNAYRQHLRMHGEDVDHQFGVDSETSKLIDFFRAIKGPIGLQLQWVRGDYDTAKESFLNINKSGRKLTDWEKKLVEYRDSSFARTVISVTNVSGAAYCWPSKQTRGSSPTVRQDVARILDDSARLHQLLFEPPYDSSFRRPQQPLLVESRTDPDTKPAYLAELLTVVKGHTGRDAQTERLLKQDFSASEEDLVKHGLFLIQECIKMCDHLIGPSSQPLSLSLVPSLYFYSDNGKHMRSLLYGFVFWLFYGGNEQDVFARKLLFSAHRAAFERILFERKRTYVDAFSRKIGSGSEVTMKMAKFYNNLLSLLLKYRDNTEAEDFNKDYEASLTKKDENVRSSSRGEQRLYNQRQKSAIALRTWLTSLPKCGICGGLLDLAEGTQYDHVREHSKGGDTVIENGRPTHPFCNNNRWTIERIMAGQDVPLLPMFADSASGTAHEIIQLSFLTDLDDFDTPLSSILESNSKS